MARAHVLVVDDEPSLRRAVGGALELEGYRVSFAADGHQALEWLGARGADAVVLDVGLPGLDGLQVCERLRTTGDRTPVLMLTARDTVADRVAGLDVGADDYLVKPFSLDELLARVRALLRRAPPGAAGVLRFDDLTLDLHMMAARRGDREMQLTHTELRLLELLLRNPRQILTRELMYERIWGCDFGMSNSLEVFVSYLRRKLEAEGEPRLIHTVRGIGYVLRDP